MNDLLSTPTAEFDNASLLPDDLLEPLSARIESQLGLNFPPARWGSLEQILVAVSRQLGFAHVATGARHLLSSSWNGAEYDALVNHLTVGETYFYRDHPLFQALERTLLPDLIAARRDTTRHLRIWSAGCCTGEEPYSVAMLLCRLIPDLNNWQISILATDINKRFLEIAERGKYGEWSFRDAPVWIQNDFFDPADRKQFQLRPHIRQMVTFKPLNLVADASPSRESRTGQMDLIFCRNVLMYFTPERQREVIKQLQESLAEGGLVFVGPSEASSTLFAPLKAVCLPGATCYRKGSGDSPGAVARVWPLASTLPAPVVEPSDPAPADPYAEALALYKRGLRAEAAERLMCLLPSGGSERTDAHSHRGAASLMARVCADQGKLDEALIRCQEALKVDSTNACDHYLCAAILVEHDRPSEAMEALRRVLFLDPRFLLAHFMLGNLQRQRGDAADARKSFENALRLLKPYDRAERFPQANNLTARQLAHILRDLLEVEA